MSIALPKTLLIGPWSLDVRRSDSALYRMERSDVVAMSDSERGFIALREDPDLTDDQLLVDLLHEIIHMILDAAGVPHDEHPERFIDTVALGLIPVLRANPDLVSALIETPASWDGMLPDSVTQC